MAINLELDDEVQTIIEDALDIKLSIDEHKGKKYLSVSLTWNGREFGGEDVDLEQLCLTSKEA